MLPQTEIEFIPSPRVLTIGHSNQIAEHFLGLLQAHADRSVVDARSHPFSIEIAAETGWGPARLALFRKSGAGAWRSITSVLRKKRTGHETPFELAPT
jgi:hypothetical protein